MAINLNYPSIQAPREEAPAPVEENNQWTDYMNQVEDYKSQQLETEVSKYFFDRSFMNGQFKTGADGLYWDKGMNVDAPLLPSQDEAWEDYQGMLKRYGVQMRAEHFDDFQTRYAQMNMRYDNQLKGKTQQLAAMGYDEDDIKRIYKETPELLHSAGVLMNDPINGAQNSIAYAPYMPKAEGDISRFLRQNEGTVAAMGAGSMVGLPMLYKGLTGAPSDIVDEAADALKLGLENKQGLKDEVSQAKKLLQTAKDRIKNAKKPSAKMKKDLKAAEDLLSEAQKRFRGAPGKKALETIQKQTLKDNARWRRFLGGTAGGFKSNLGRAGAFFGIPYAVEALAEGVTGDEKVGDLVGASTQATIGLQPIVSSMSAAWKKHGATAIMKEVMKKGGLGLAARTIGKVGAGTVGGIFSGGLATGVMAAWTMKDMYEIYNIIKDMD